MGSKKEKKKSVESQLFFSVCVYTEASNQDCNTQVATPELVLKLAPQALMTVGCHVRGFSVTVVVMYVCVHS